MTLFSIVGHLARTDGSFSLNDLPGSGGRMDVLCRCVSAALFLSHGIRYDTDCCLILCGEPAGPKTIRFSGSTVRSLSPDERSAAALIKKVIDTPCGSEFREAAAGIFIRKGGLERLLAEFAFGVLDENGPDIRKAKSLPAAFLLSDHRNFSEQEEELIRALPRFSAGPQCLHADHAITLVHNELDRRMCGWK
jgi:tRNA (pseudouridine54-N1)-methyltransferase